MSTPFKNVIFRRNGMSFFAGKHTGVYSLNHRFTCRPEARQVLIYQCISDLTGENDKYNHSKAAHLYPSFSYILSSAKNYKVAPALTPLTDEEVALKTLLNSLGYDIIKTRGKYFFNYEHGGSEISTDDLNELLNCAQNGLKVAAKTLELKLMHKVFTSISHTETAPQSPPSPQVSTDTTPPPEGAEGPQEGE